MSGQEWSHESDPEFPDGADTWTDPVSRRQFLTLMGASVALAGAAGCSGRPAPAEKIMPYVHQPEGVVPGKPLYFATAMAVSGYGHGLLVKSTEGRPTKVEGNPTHPSSPPAFPNTYRFGPTDLFSQASILDFYDPDRSPSVTYVGEPRPWNEFLATFRGELAKLRAARGAGLRLLTGTVTSPTLAWQMEQVLRQFPDAVWHQYEPASRAAALDGAKQAFREGYVQTLYDLSKADVIVSLDADFLSCGPGNLRYTRDFAARRRVWDKAPGQARMNRLYALQSSSTTTGASADEPLSVPARTVQRIALALAAELGVPGAPREQAGNLSEQERRWLTRAARDLAAHRGATAVLVGEAQPAIVHAAAHAINQHLGNVGQTVRYTEAVEFRPEDPFRSLGALVEAMRAGQVRLLVIMGTNPVFTAPTDLPFEDALQHVPLRVHLGQYQDETAVQCHWHIPEAHYLEAWSDTRAHDGTVSIVQPLIQPLYAGRSIHEFIAAMGDQPEQTGHDIVQGYWRAHWPAGAGEFETGWRESLRSGIIADTQARPRSVTLRPDWASNASPEPAGDGLEIVFRPDPAVYDGRFANNAWLQEFPRPITRMTWDNPVLLSPATAQSLGLKQDFGHNGGERGQAIAPLVRLQYRGGEMVAPAWIVPGHPDSSVTVHFGQGRTRAGRVGTGVGFDFYRLRTTAAPWHDGGLKITPTGETYQLGCVQMHHTMAERAPVRTQTLAGHRGEQGREDAGQRLPRTGATHAEEPEPTASDRRLTPLTLYPEREFPYAGYKWAMSIDLTSCVGCGACVVACQAENNIPIVGKSEVLRGREMHWLRIDRYYPDEHADPAALGPATYFQPVPCMHCENAPCELVCPVAATVHSDDGLNDMVYNRCVGTRYCSNNCPYKVRRFNFFEYADYATKSLRLMHNPDVTVRSRGVMEKCTYCVQRIRAAEIEAKREERVDPDRPETAPIHDGEMMTACQAACPAGAIVFGDMNDKNARVTQMKRSPLDYGLLASLNTRPRTTYLAAVKNPG